MPTISNALNNSSPNFTMHMQHRYRNLPKPSKASRTIPMRSENRSREHSTSLAPKKFRSGKLQAFWLCSHIDV
jgi:hypothetical protein